MNIKEVEQNIDLAVNLLKAISNEHRLRILCTLYKQERCVGEIEQIVGLSQSALSQHLARLRQDCLVQTRREKQTIYYSLNECAAQAILQCLYDIYSPDDVAMTDGGIVTDSGSMC